MELVCYQSLPLSPSHPWGRLAAGERYLRYVRLRGTCWSQMVSGTVLREEVRVGTNRKGIKIIFTGLRAE